LKLSVSLRNENCSSTRSRVPSSLTTAYTLRYRVSGDALPLKTAVICNDIILTVTLLFQPKASRRKGPIATSELTNGIPSSKRSVLPLCERKSRESIGLLIPLFVGIHLNRRRDSQSSGWVSLRRLIRRRATPSESWHLPVSKDRIHSLTISIDRRVPKRPSSLSNLERQEKVGCTNEGRRLDGAENKAAIGDRGSIRYSGAW